MKEIFVVKKHVYTSRLILAVCDKDLLGRRFENKDKLLDLNSSFYKGELMDEGEVLILMKEAYILNLVGKLSVELALKNKLISKDRIFTIKNIPYAQSVKDE